MRILLVSLFFFISLFAVENVSLSRLIVQFQNNEYNMLIAPKLIILPHNFRKTKKAINKGYKRAIHSMFRTLQYNKLNANLKQFTPRGAGIPQYNTQDKQTYTILKNLMKDETKISESLKDEFKSINTNSRASSNKKDDVDAYDLNGLSDSSFDITSDKGSTDDKLDVSPKDIFIDAFVEMSELYNPPPILELRDAKHPFYVSDGVKMKSINGIFGMSFFPTTESGVKYIRIYVFLFVINTEGNKSVQIIVKEIPKVKWGRNYRYISGISGRVLRQVVSLALGRNIPNN